MQSTLESMKKTPENFSNSESGPLIDALASSENPSAEPEVVGRVVFWRELMLTSPYLPSKQARKEESC